MMFKDTVIFEEHRKFLKVCYSFCNVDEAKVRGVRIMLNILEELFAKNPPFYTFDKVLNTYQSIAWQDSETHRRTSV